MKTEEKRAKEKKTISLMIAIYCKGKHKQDTLCKKCKELETYAHSRIMCCPKMETKTFCSNCKVHCYSNEMRQRIKEVMRYSGPRMLIHDPVMAISHLISSFKERRRKS